MPEAPGVSGGLGTGIHDAPGGRRPERGGGRQHDRAVELDLGLVAGGVKDLIADAECPGATAAAARRVAQIDPAEAMRQDGWGELLV